MRDTFIDTGEDVFTNRDIAGDLMSMAGWNWGDDHVFPQDERPNLVVSVGGAYSSIADYYARGITRKLWG